MGIVNSGTGKAIGYTSADQWMEYTVNVAEDGEYDIVASVSNGSGAGKLNLAIDGKQIASLSFTGTSNDWDAYEDATGKATLTKGQHVLRITIANDNTNVDYVKFSKEGGEPQSIAADLRLNAAGKTYQVFDMQGRTLGKVDVAAGASIADALFAKFQQTGVYMVKQGSKLTQVRVTR
nr:carbohydrate-binding protein [Fibrobacter succinogenes]